MLYELPNFEHIDTSSVQEAVFWLQEYGDEAKVIAGGTDLLGLMKEKLEGPQLRTPKLLINIKTISGMNQITSDEELGVRIGAAVTLDQLDTAEVIRERFDILSQAARQVGTTQIRNMGTVGGNLCQRPQCMYFRHPDFVCYKKGGTKCFAVAGEHRYDHSIIKYGKCVMAHPSDMAPALIALKATAIIATPEGEKKSPMQDFFLGPDNFAETILKPGEFLAGIQVPNQNSLRFQLFLKHRIRHASDFALSSVALVTQISDGSLEDLRLVVGGVAPFPYVPPGVNDITKGKTLNKRLISQVAEASVEDVRPLRMNRYKVDLVDALVKRALGLAQKQIPKA